MCIVSVVCGVSRTYKDNIYAIAAMQPIKLMKKTVLFI
jgi:hypothetical protein